MRTLLTFCLLVLGCCVGYSGDDVAPLLVEQVAVHDIVFTSLEDAIQGAKEQGKPTLIVLFDESARTPFSELYEIASNMQESPLSSFVNFLVLCPQSGEQQADPALAEILAFRERFSETSFPNDRTCIVTIAVTSDSELVVDMTELPLV